MSAPTTPADTTLRVPVWRTIFYLLLAAGAVLTVIRFTQGLGAVTNLSDSYPWGLWVGFDLLCGVGLASGGFVVTAAVYVLNIERLKPIARPAILTAFLGYLLVVVALMFDLGRPWNIWHPLIMWNPSSVMFEVAWCVTLYSTVLWRSAGCSSSASAGTASCASSTRSPSRSWSPASCCRPCTSRRSARST
mgnify:CR=1 FL=1